MTACDAQTTERVLGYLQERFGIPESVFTGYTLYESSRGRIHLGPRSLPPELDIDSVGCIIARVQKSVKPSTHLFTLFGRHVSRSRIELTHQQVIDYVKGADIIVDNNQMGRTRLGFVMLSYRGLGLGCGLMRTRNRVENVLPRSNRMSIELL